MKKLQMNSYMMNFFLIGLLISSILTALILKIQQRSVVDGVTFNHPLMQTTIMFIAEGLCYFCFLFYKRRYKQNYEKQRQYEVDTLGKKANINKFLFAIPSLIDFVDSFLTLMAMSMMPFSFYYMIRGGNVIITAIFSIILLKRELYKHNYVGLLMNFFGFLTVGISAIITSETDQDSTYLIFGVVLIIVTYFTTTSQLVFEEKLFKTYFLHPLEVVGWEGFWGIIFSLIGIGIFSNVPCFINMQDCPNSKMEDVPSFFEMIFNVSGSDQPTLLIMILLGIVLIILLNGFSMTVTTHANCLMRSVITAVSPFIVWLLTISIGWDKFNYGQFCGYLIITIGAMIYSEVLVIPFWGMNHHHNNKSSPNLRKVPYESQIKGSSQTPYLNTQRSQLNTTCFANNKTNNHTTNCKIIN